MPARKSPSRIQNSTPDADTAESIRYARPWMSGFLLAFSRAGNISEAARAAQVTRRTVYLARERDQDFAAGWEEALHDAADRIRAEVTRRAIEGWEEPVYGRVGKDRDGQLTDGDGKPLFIRKFDNGLLARLAQAHCPEFREKNPAAATVNVTIQISAEKLHHLQERRRVQMARITHGRN